MFVWVFCPNRELFIFMEISPSKCFKFWPKRNTIGHYAVGVLWRVYCETRHPFMIVISKEPRHSHMLPSVWQYGCLYLFERLSFVAFGDRTPEPLRWLDRSLWKIQIFDFKIFKIIINGALTHHCVQFYMKAIYLS